MSLIQFDDNVCSKNSVDIQTNTKCELKEESKKIIYVNASKPFSFNIKNPTESYCQVEIVIGGKLVQELDTIKPGEFKTSQEFSIDTSQPVTIKWLATWEMCSGIHEFCAHIWTRTLIPVTTVIQRDKKHK